MREWESRGRGHLIRSLKEVFAYFGKSYNSKIFAGHLCDDLEIDNSVLHEIIEGLYHTRDNAVFYDFSAIDADVLGTIYEQYLGHILKKTEKRATLKENHVHKKEQGIYYTPTRIVDYIVRNALGELLKGKNVNVEHIRVLDPACGSGSFLIKAFDVLDEYRRNSEEYYQTQLDTTGTGSTYSRKLAILTNSIFGVDLDKQAVEIAQLNLLLKIAEKGHRLPLLEQNIRIGNSLIEDEELAGDRAFNWKEKFKQAMEEGGFDLIVGNPPYYNIKSDSELRKLEDYKLLSNGVVNASALFVKRSIDLLKPNGYLGFIIPKSFAYVDSWKPLRDFIYQNTQLIKIADVSRAFEEVLLEQVIIVVRKQKAKLSKLVDVVSEFDSPNQRIDRVEYGSIIASNSIVLSSSTREKHLSEKMRQCCVMLGEISENFRGIGAQQFVTKAVSDSERILSGKEIQRYSVTNYNSYFILKENLSLFNKAEKLRQPKIMCQNIVAHIKNHIKITAAFDENGTLNLDTVNNIIVKDSRFLPKYILALLNSKLISYYTYSFIYSKAIRTMHFDGNYSGKIPVKEISPENQRAFEGMVNRLISLSSKLSKTGVKETDETQRTRNEIDSLQKDLDNRIYELYGLDREEIATVEESFE
jgi:type I restriction-modification system DNA methylase subunit